MRPVGPDHLFGEDAAGAFHLPGPGRGRDIDRLGPHRVPFLEFQRAVVDAGRQAEAVFGERGFAAIVAPVHAADLRHGDMAFVHEDQRFVGQIFEQRRRRLAGFAPRQPARIILDAGAGAGRLDHLQIEDRALFQALRFQQLAVVAEPVEPLAQLLFDAFGRLRQRRPRRHIMRIGIDLDRSRSPPSCPSADRTRRWNPLRRRTARCARRGLRNAPGRCRWCRRARGRSRARNCRRCACIAAPPDSGSARRDRSASSPSPTRPCRNRSPPRRCRRCRRPTPR